MIDVKFLYVFIRDQNQVLGALPTVKPLFNQMLFNPVELTFNDVVNVLHDVIKLVFIAWVFCIPALSIKLIVLFCANFGIRKKYLSEEFIFDKKKIFCEFFEKLGLNVAFVLKILRQLFGVKINDFSHMVVGSWFSGSASPPSCVKLSTVCTIWSYTIVFLFNVSVKSRVR